MTDKPPTPLPPDAKKTEKKQLTEVQKLKLFSVHLNQRITQLESEKIKQMQTIVMLQSQIQDLKAVTSNTEADAVYKELGIAKGDEIELQEDGTLIINPPPPKGPATASEAPLIKAPKKADRRTAPRPPEEPKA